MGKIFCVEFQRVPLKFHTKYFTHILKDVIFIQQCDDLLFHGHQAITWINADLLFSAFAFINSLESMTGPASVSL